MNTLAEHVQKLRTQLEEAKKERDKLRMVLDPRQWTREMSDAWHKALPDTVKAFAAHCNLETKTSS